MNTANQTGAPLTEAALMQAYGALNQGKAASAHRLAQSVLSDAIGLQDVHLEAKALACLAHCDRLMSKFRRSHHASQRAAHLFNTVGDTVGEVGALAIQSYAAGALGRNEEAVEMALLSLTLGEPLSNETQSAVARIHLGVAYFFSKTYDKANAAFEESRHISARCNPPLNPFQSLVTQASGETVRVMAERYETGELPDLTFLNRLLEQCAAHTEHELPSPLATGVHVSVQGYWRLAKGAARCWAGDLAGAEADLAIAQGWMALYGQRTSHHALDYMLRAEIAWARQDWAQAEADAAMAIQISSEVEHEQFACLGHLLAGQLFELQGKQAEALGELRKLMQRQQRIRAESVESRARVLDWKENVRRSGAGPEGMKRRATDLVALATAETSPRLANSAQLEERLFKMLRAHELGVDALSVATVQIRAFDELVERLAPADLAAVVTVLSESLAQHFRENDVAAYRGDGTFVVALKGTDGRLASVVCRNLEDSVLAHDWASIAPGLSVSVGVALSEAVMGDTVRSLLLRSADTALSSTRPAPAELAA